MVLFIGDSISFVVAWTVSWCIYCIMCQ